MKTKKNHKIKGVYTHTDIAFTFTHETLTDRQNKQKLRANYELNEYEMKFLHVNHTHTQTSHVIFNYVLL